MIENRVNRALTRIVRWLAVIVALLAGGCICLLLCVGCRDLHIHLGETVYVQKASGQHSVISPQPSAVSGVGHQEPSAESRPAEPAASGGAQSPDDILQEVIDELVDTETSRQTPGEP